MLKRSAARVSAPVLALCSTLTAIAPAHEVKAAEPPRRAVVVGNFAYTAMPPLPGCDASSRTVAAALRRAGFEVTLLANPTNARMGAALAGLADQVAAAGDLRSVVYVCGYAATFRDRLFLLPIEASITQDTELLTQGILGRLAFSAVANAGAGLLAIDAQPRPGSAVAAFSLGRQGDGGRSGYAVSLGPLDAPVAARLAGALADALGSGQVEAGGFLAELGTKPARAGATLAVAAPSSPAWLTGEPAQAAPAPAPPVAEAAPAPPPAAPAPAPAAAPPPPAAEPPGTPAARAGDAGDEPATLSVAEIGQVQGELKRIGYYRGAVDGRVGPETIVAIRLYQREAGSEITGRLTRRQLERLLRH